MAWFSEFLPLQHHEHHQRRNRQRGHPRRSGGMVRPLRAAVLARRPCKRAVPAEQRRGAPTAVDAELAAFIETALSYCREVDGLFDVTMGSATQLWNFKDCMIPARDDVARGAAARGLSRRHRERCRRDAARPASLRRFGRASRKATSPTASSRCCANAAWNTLWSTSAATWPSWAASPMEHRGAWASAVPFPPARCRCLIRSPSWPCAMARP